MEESTGVEVDGEVEGIDGVPNGDGLPALGVVGVALDVHHPVKELVWDGDDDGDAVGQAVDDDVRTWEVGDDGGRRGNRDAHPGPQRVLHVTLNASAETPGVRDIELRTSNSNTSLKNDGK